MRGGGGVKKIYEYETRTMVEFSDGSRASYSAKRYGDLLEDVVRQSYDQDEKIWNPYRIEGKETHIYYWEQKNSKIVDILIDTEDLELVKSYYWQLNVKGYPVSRSHGRKTYLYNLVMNNNNCNMVVDHINRNPLINIKSNLRIVTPQINARNKTTADRNKEIPFNGVHYNKKGNGKIYRMRIIDLDGNTIDETFDTLEEAKQKRIFYEQQFGYLRRFND